jgi:putative oxidoreductase
LTWIDRSGKHLIAAFRIVVGLLFASHGSATLLGIPARAGAHTPAFGAWPSWWAAAIQLTCGLLLVVGLGTRAAALLGSGSMAYAYFSVHQPKGLLPMQNGGEPAALFCWALLAIAVVGPGAWAVGNLMRARRHGSGGTGDNNGVTGGRRTTASATPAGAEH